MQPLRTSYSEGAVCAFLKYLFFQRFQPVRTDERAVPGACLCTIWELWPYSISFNGYILINFMDKLFKITVLLRVHLVLFWFLFPLLFYFFVIVTARFFNLTTLLSINSYIVE